MNQVLSNAHDGAAKSVAAFINPLNESMTSSYRWKDKSGISRYTNWLVLNKIPGFPA